MTLRDGDKSPVESADKSAHSKAAAAAKKAGNSRNCSGGTVLINAATFEKQAGNSQRFEGAQHALPTFRRGSFALGRARSAMNADLETFICGWGQQTEREQAQLHPARFLDTNTLP